MADKMAAVQGYGCISSVYMSFQVVWLIAFRRVPASMLNFLVQVYTIYQYSDRDEADAAVSYCPGGSAAGAAAPAAAA